MATPKSSSGNVEDFFHTTVPYFFDYYGDLNPNVGFAQCPKYFPHVQERENLPDGLALEGVGVEGCVVFFGGTLDL